MNQFLIDSKTERPKFPPVIKSAVVIENPFPDITPRVKKVETITPKEEKKKGVKNMKLLSFGDDEEEEDEMMKKEGEEIKITMLGSYHFAENDSSNTSSHHSNSFDPRNVPEKDRKVIKSERGENVDGKSDKRGKTNGEDKEDEIKEKEVRRKIKLENEENENQKNDDRRGDRDDRRDNKRDDRRSDGNDKRDDRKSDRNDKKDRKRKKDRKEDSDEESSKKFQLTEEQASLEFEAMMRKAALTGKKKNTIFPFLKNGLKMFL